MVASNRSEAAVAPPRATSLAFVDLEAQQRRIRPAVDAAIRRVLDHGQYIMGPEVAELEQRLARFAGAKHAISCSSGTDALLIAMMAKGIGPGDAILCPNFTYTATPETIALLGASPVFVDVASETFNIDVADLEAGYAAAEAAGLKPRGVIAVDLFGLPADYAGINAFAVERGLFVLGDAAQGFGATYHGRRTGSLAEMTATSFFPAKPLGCYGDGGALFTDDDRLADIAKSIRLHGKGEGKYDIVRIGINGRLDTIQAAILLQKLDIFEDEIQRRNALAASYSSTLRGAVQVPVVAASCESVWAQYTVRIPAAKRAEVVGKMNALRIPTQVYYPRPLSAQPAYARYPVSAGGTPVSFQHATEVLSLPMHPYLEEADRAVVTTGLLRSLGV